MVNSLLDPATPILIVDDNPQYSKILKLMLERTFGYTDVTVVDRVGPAFELVEKSPQRFNVLFVDFNFPDGENGGQLLSRLAKAGLLESKTAFLITAEPTVENFKQAMAAGASGIVAKPFDSQELKKQLEKADRARQQDEADSF